jgi:hypothetical protein
MIFGQLFAGIGMSFDQFHLDLTECLVDQLE